MAYLSISYGNVHHKGLRKRIPINMTLINIIMRLVRLLEKYYGCMETYRVDRYTIRKRVVYGLRKRIVQKMLLFLSADLKLFKVWRCIFDEFISTKIFPIFR